MHYLAFLFVAILSLFVGVAKSLLPSASVDNLRFFALQWGQSSIANILRFQSTMIIPAGPHDQEINGVNALWPGMQPTQANVILQTVTANGNVGDWELKPYYCCNPQEQLVPNMRVYPGDTLTNTYSLDVFTMGWHVDWLVIPGPNGHAAGMESFSGELVFDPNAPQNAGDGAHRGETYTNAIFAIELQGGGQWNFGPLSWRDIILEINTTDTNWCKSGPYVQGMPFNYTFSPPVTAVVDQVTRCYIAQMDFWNP